MDKCHRFAILPPGKFAAGRFAAPILPRDPTRVEGIRQRRDAEAYRYDAEAYRRDVEAYRCAVQPDRRRKRVQRDRPLSIRFLRLEAGEPIGRDGGRPDRLKKGTA